MKLITLAILLCLTYMTSASTVSAMNFKITDWRNHQVLSAKGIIRQGDAAKLANAINRLRPLPHGSPVVLLDSPGGNVAEALEIAEIFDKQQVHTIVPNGAQCASACASILFVGGALRTVEPSGRFGQHSCSVGGKPDHSCNDLIAHHALEHGVSYGSVAAFVTYAPPDEMIWFDRRFTDCYGISKYPFSKIVGFEKSEPCVIAMIRGTPPPGQSKWRVDFFKNGYRSFVRPLSDHERLFQLNLFCDENTPGTLFLGLEIPRPKEIISSIIKSAHLNADPVNIKYDQVKFQNLDNGYSQSVIEIPRNKVIDFLKKSNKLHLEFQVNDGYDPISVTTFMRESRKSLLFAANNCIK